MNSKTKTTPAIESGIHALHRQVWVTEYICAMDQMVEQVKAGHTICNRGAHGKED